MRALRVTFILVVTCLPGRHFIPSAAAQTLPGSERLVIAVAGDTLPESSWAGPQEVEHFLDAMREEFARADLVFLNLEQPITAGHTVTPNKNPADVAAGRDYILRARNPAIPRIIKEAGVGLFSARTAAAWPCWPSRTSCRTTPRRLGPVWESLRRRMRLTWWKRYSVRVGRRSL